MEEDVFAHQSVSRAVRTAFVLGVLIVVAIVAAVASYHQFSALVGDNTKDELSRYLDDNAHTTARPSGAGFTIDFPVPATRQSEKVSTGLSTITVPRDDGLVDDEITFQVLWFDQPGGVPADPTKVLNAYMSLQMHQLAGTRIATDAVAKFDAAILRDFVFRNVDSTGTTRYYDERVMLKDGRVYIIRVASRVRRDEAFRKFAASFAFTK